MGVVFKGKEGRNAYTITTCLVKDNVNLADELDELVATHKDEDILIEALGSKEPGGRV
ncbi:hypothetical protein E6C27_scaffold1639G00350 [Cucumis melo var. makuwa]|uniref:Uncharacterized protein n=1 Tax=Cucumis melo var. makuwa TaxID=1194695 RepID=A0A5A7TN07_CUCMM|nr:hypothetical protein E6C27_scaffold1639G00350 [Cucumis melo var. makuwa]